MKSAIVTGVTGQSGSYLAELLLEKDYKVYGFKRRSSSNDLGNVAHLEKDIEIIEGDLLDLSSLSKLCKLAKADEFYNLAAMSHVGISFEQPIYTAQCTGLGVLNCLEAIKSSGLHTRFLQASTSELYGGIRGEVKLNEETPFYPRSPYGVAKLYGHWITINYRESYKMFACNSICFNHECFFADTPVIIQKENSNIDIVYVSSLVPNIQDLSKDTIVSTKEYDTSNIKIWDGKQFKKLKAVTRKKLSSLQNIADQQRQITVSSGVSISTTPNHKLVKTETITKEARDMIEGTELVLGTYPKCKGTKVITEEFAELLGLLAGDGYIEERVGLASNNQAIQKRFIALAKTCFCNISYSIKSYVSDYDSVTTQTDLKGLSESKCKVLREMLYEARTKHKKVPAIILNSSTEVQLAFLKGYFQADSLKKQHNTAYEFKTNSPLLAQGILYIIKNTIGSEYCINAFEQNGEIYHQIYLRSSNKIGHDGDHFILQANTVKKVINRNEDNQDVFDIETESGVVMAGIGTAIVGNSPRRGPNFVTRKITKAIAAISAGKQDYLYLGNLDAKRDWSHAKDCVEGMWKILNHSKPEDFVFASGETHSIKEFCEIAFNSAGLGNYEQYVKIDPQFYRPTEVDVLLGDSTKARTVLDWKPQYSFRDLVKEMVEFDLSSQ